MPSPLPASDEGLDRHHSVAQSRLTCDSALAKLRVDSFLPPFLQRVGHDDMLVRVRRVVRERRRRMMPASSSTVKRRHALAAEQLTAAAIAAPSRGEQATLAARHHDVPRDALLPPCVVLDAVIAEESTARGRTRRDLEVTLAAALDGISPVRTALSPTMELGVAGVAEGVVAVTAAPHHFSLHPVLTVHASVDILHTGQGRMPREGDVMSGAKDVRLAPRYVRRVLSRPVRPTRHRVEELVKAALRPL
eukprot:scaffold48_cov311-Pinguiococcus_pyrenoidosus.AAC.60